MNHQDAWALLEQFLDGTLPAVDRWAVIAHLNDCPHCRGQVANQARLRGQVRDHLAGVEPPAGLAERLQTSLAAGRIDAPRPAPLSWPVALAPRIAAVLGPALVALWLLVRVTMPVASSAPDFPGELVATHALFAQDESLLDVAGDAAAVTAWFRETAGIAVSAPELGGYELLGGRLIALHGQPVAQLVYESHPDEAYLSLLHVRTRGWQAPNGAEFAPLALDRRGTVSVVTWPAADGRSALIGDLPEAELRKLAGQLSDWSGA